MRRSITIALLTLAGLMLSGSAVADTTINCPLTQARRTITDRLPDGWWTTPLVNRLSEAKISKISGRTALLCVYGSSGSVQRYAPKGHLCRSTGRGFRCVVQRPVFSTGRIEVPQTYTFDLDHGRVGSAGGGVDLWFEAETRDLLYLTPRGGARISVGNRSNRGYAGCSAARFSPQRVSLRDVPVGSYVCVRTGEGRISQIKLHAVSGGSPKTLAIGYMTWK